ncbi:MAG: class I SAM-dependent methyltransferase [Acidobacteria bacterium]|nr:class I SAM-dependent methyltransferase [Acidobacteriota bacterium]
MGKKRFPIYVRPVLNRQVLRLAKQWLPKALIAKLDPFEDYIARFTAAVAAQVSVDERVLDAGAGEGRFRSAFENARYVGVDNTVGDETWDYSRIDTIADLSQIPFRTAAFDHVLCVVVLEHTREPGIVLREFSRVLRPCGAVHMIVPLLWEEHQKPYDYFRFTSHGLEYLLGEAGFEIQRMEPIGGFFWVLARRCVTLLTFFQNGWRKGIFLLLAPVFGLALPVFCYYLDRLDQDKHFTLGFAVTARKKNEV